MSHLFICVVKKCTIPDMKPHGQFPSSFQNWLCGLIFCQSEKELSVFVGMSSSRRLESLLLSFLSIKDSFNRVWFSPSFAVVASSGQYVMVLKRYRSRNLLAEEMLVWERQPKHWFFFFSILWERNTTFRGVWGSQWAVEKPGSKCNSLFLS